MPKRTGHLYEKMLNRKLIRYVIIEGSKHKRKRHDVTRVMKDVDGYVEKVYDLLANDDFVPSIPKHVTIHDNCSNKEREIGVVPFYPDGIIHRLIVEVARPVFMRGMYAHSCASIPGRGNDHAIRYMKKSLRDIRGTKYTAKMDIRHYYRTISHRKMMRTLERKIKDRRFLALIHRIITSDSEGLTIGFYLNQWLANVFLEPLDHMIKDLDGVKYYVRNMDDMVLMGPNKKKLHQAVRTISDYLAAMGLELKHNWQVFRTDSRGVDFIGYRFFHTHTLMRRRNFLKFTRQCRKAKELISQKRTIPVIIAAGLLSRYGQLKYCSSANVRRKYFDGISERRLKSIIRRDAWMKRRAEMKIPQPAAA